MKRGTKLELGQEWLKSDGSVLVCEKEGRHYVVHGLYDDAYTLCADKCEKLKDSDRVILFESEVEYLQWALDRAQPLTAEALRRAWDDERDPCIIVYRNRSLSQHGPDGFQWLRADNVDDGSPWVSWSMLMYNTHLPDVVVYKKSEHPHGVSITFNIGEK